MSRAALRQLLEGFRTGYAMAKACHEIDPEKFPADRLALLQKSIEELEQRIKADETAPPRPVKYDPIKEKADRAERRSAERKG